MHTEAIDHSTGIMGYSSSYSDCIQPQYSPIEFSQYEYSSSPHSFGRTPSTSSCSSELSESLSNMSISSADSPSISECPSDAFSTSDSSSINSINVNSNIVAPRQRKHATVSKNSSVPRRSSAPTRNNKMRKDSFVYDVQLDNDNVLLFVPDLDLVKSHLMFAVREEVDVLKEHIGELMERINHLEYENTVLRKYAPEEALQQLQNPNQNQ